MNHNQNCQTETQHKNVNIMKTGIKHSTSQQSEEQEEHKPSITTKYLFVSICLNSAKLTQLG